MTYEYVCTSCHHEWEAEQRISEPALDTCPVCAQRTARRQVSGGAGFILKGGGWYADGYSSGGTSGKKGADGGAGVSSSSGASSDSTPAPSGSTGSPPKTGSESGKAGATGTPAAATAKPVAA